MSYETYWNPLTGILVPRTWRDAIFDSGSVQGTFRLACSYRTQWGSLARTLALAVLKTIGRFSRLSLTVDWGQGLRRVRVPILGVSNNPYDKIDGLFVHRSRLDGGRLGIYIARARTPLQLLLSILAVMSSHWQITPNLVVAEATEVVIDGRRRQLLVATDGEVQMLGLPLRYRVRPKALRVLVPGQSRKS